MTATNSLVSQPPILLTPKPIKRAQPPSAFSPDAGRASPKSSRLRHTRTERRQIGRSSAWHPALQAAAGIAVALRCRSNRPGVRTVSFVGKLPAQSHLDDFFKRIAGSIAPALEGREGTGLPGNARYPPFETFQVGDSGFMTKLFGRPNLVGDSRGICVCRSCPLSNGKYPPAKPGALELGPPKRPKDDRLRSPTKSPHTNHASDRVSRPGPVR